MQSLHEIRRHIRSVEQTRQITNAMYLLSTSRMKKAMGRMAYSREYYMRMRATMKDILTNASGIQDQYLEQRASQRAAYLVIASDKGMCGAFNTNVLNLAWEHLESHPEHYVCTAGIMATQFFARRGITPDIELLGVVQNPTLANARDITESLLHLYDDGLMDEVYIVFTRFINSAQQFPQITRLLPLRTENFLDVELEFEHNSDILYRPSPEEVFRTLVPQYMVGLVYGAFVQSYASEHSARMTAMLNATKNADEMANGLRMQYNSARQYAITQEISEIVAGAGWEENQ